MVERPRQRLHVMEPKVHANEAPHAERRDKYRFVAISDPTGLQDAQSRQISRTHAVRYALGRRDKRSQCDFRIVTPDEITDPRRRRRKRTGSTPKTDDSIPKAPGNRLNSPKPTLTDPLDWDYRKLQHLLSHHSAREAGIPVFSIHTAISYQHFSVVFACGLEDQALVNALLYCLSYFCEQRINAECISYKHRAIQHLKKRMTCTKTAVQAAEATIKAILLLVGVETRLGLRSQVELHLQGVSRILHLCQNEQIALTDGLKRSIFWRDLDSAVLIGSKRIVSQKTFSELSWQRDPFLAQSYSLPRGFATRSEMFPDDFLTVVEDMHSLQILQDSQSLNIADHSLLFRLDNQQAWQESRIHYLMCRTPDDDHRMQSCYWAAYLCSYVSFTSIWGSLLMPSHCSMELLRHLKASEWQKHEDLLLWLVLVGAAYAPDGLVRSQYAVLITGKFRDPLSKYAESWEQIEECAKTFIWPKCAFESRCRAFWDETCLC